MRSIWHVRNISGGRPDQAWSRTPETCFERIVSKSQSSCTYSARWRSKQRQLRQIKPDLIVLKCAFHSNGISCETFWDHIQPVVWLWSQLWRRIPASQENSWLWRFGSFFRLHPPEEEHFLLESSDQKQGVFADWKKKSAEHSMTSLHSAALPVASSQILLRRILKRKGKPATKYFADLWASAISNKMKALFWFFFCVRAAVVFAKLGFSLLESGNCTPSYHFQTLHRSSSSAACQER